MEKFLKNQQIPLTQVIDPNTGQAYYSTQNVVYQDKNNTGVTYLKNVIVDQASTASYFSGSVSNAISASYALTASYVLGLPTSSVSASYALSASYASNGGVTQLLAGPNITLSPTNGLGQVTISSTGGGGGTGNTATGSYGSFYSTQTQTNVASTPRSMSLNTTDITNGVSISGSTNPFNTYIKVANAGVYDIQFSAQVDKTDSGTDEIWIWIRKNGTDISDSATSVQLTGNGAHYVAAWNFFVNAAANDYFQLMWYSPDANVRLHAESAFGVVPGIPSLIVTANRVDQFLSNTGSFSGSFIGAFTGSFSGSGNITSASYAATASYVNPLNQTVIVTGSLIVSGSSTFTNIGPAVFSGSITQTASTASFGGLVNIGTIATASSQLNIAEGSLTIGAGYGYGALYGYANDGIVQIKTAATYKTQIWLRPSGNANNYNTNYWSRVENDSGTMNILGSNYGALYIASNAGGGNGAGISFSGATGIGTNALSILGPTNSGRIALTTYGSSPITINGGNLLVGSTTDAGSKLLVRGSGTTSATTSLLVQNANASASLSVTDDSTFYFKGASNTSLRIKSAIEANSSVIQFNNDGLGGGYSGGYTFTNGGNGSYGSGVSLRIYPGKVAIGNVTEGTLQNNATNLYVDNTQTGGRNKAIKLNVNFANISTEYNGINFDTIENGAGGAFVGSQHNPLTNGYDGDLAIFCTGGNNSSYTEIARFVGKSKSLSLGAGKNPSASLHISGSSGSALLEIDSPSVNNILFVSGSGNVGIGTGTPGLPLDVSGSAIFRNTTYIRGTDQSASTINFVAQDSSVNTLMRLYNDGSLTVGRSGATTIPLTIVGNSGVQATIGNGSFASPSNIYRYGGGTLTFYGTNNNSSAFYFSFNNAQSSNTTTTSMISLGGTYGNQLSFQFANLNITPAYDFASNTTSAAIARGIYYNPTLTNLRVAQHRAIETVTGDVIFGSTSGNVGIGTSTPSSRLTVSGSAGTGSAIYAYKSGSTVLDIQGSQGQLFSVIDALSGSLMSVNDVSGLPILEVFSDDRVVMGTYGAPALTVTGSTLIATGSLLGTASYATTALSASYAPSSPAFPFTGSARITGSLDVRGATTITGSFQIKKAGGTIPIMDTTTGMLYDVYGGTSINYQSWQLQDYYGTATLDWYNKRLQSDGNIFSLDWQNRTLNNGAGTAVLNWSGSGVQVTGSLNVSNGSLTVGNITSTPSNENTLNVYPSPAGGVGEGGQILLAASGGLYTSASMLDTYQNQFRLLKGTNTGGSTVAYIITDLQSGNTQFAGAVTASAYSGLPNDYLYAIRRSTNQTIGSGTWADRDIIFNFTVVSKGITYDTSTGLADLVGGKVYRITSRLAWSAAATYLLQYSCYDNSNNQLGPIVEIIQSTNGTNNISDGTLDFIYAPISNIKIKIRTTNNTTALTGEEIRADLNTQLIIQQIA